MQDIEAIETRLWTSADNLRANSNYARDKEMGSNLQIPIKENWITIKREKHGKAIEDRV
jgi:hypothetical protein